MKFSINSKILASALSAVVRAVDPKAPLMVLQNFKFALTVDGSLIIKGMSAEAEAQQTIKVTESEGADEFCINARQLTDFIKKLPDCGITFAYDGLQLEILVNKGKYVIPTIAAHNFPESRKIEGESIEIPAQSFINGLTRTKFAISNDDFRPVMQGVFMDVLPDKIVYVATDTRVLVRCTFDIATGKSLSFIIPKGVIPMLTALFAKSEKLKITLSENSAQFEADNVLFVATLIKGKYPDYQRVIRNVGQHTLSVNKKSLTAAIERVQDFGDSSMGLIKISAGGMLGELRVSAANDGMNTSGNDYVPCETGCSNLVIGINAPYLLSVLATLQGEDVLLSNITEGTASAPIHFTETDEGMELLALVMPMSVVE